MTAQGGTAMLDAELAQTQSALEQSNGVLKDLNSQLEQLVSKSPLLRQELERKIHLAQARRDCAQRLVTALESEKQASAPPSEDAKAQLVYGQHALETNRARAEFSSNQDEAKVAGLLNWQRDEPHSNLLQTYQSLCDFHSAAGRPQRQALGEFLAREKVPLPQLDVLAVTWNMGNAAPNPLDLDKLIPMRAGNRLYDLVVVGAQECGFDLSPDMLEKATRFRTQVKREAKIVLQQAIVPHSEDAMMEEGSTTPPLLPKFVTAHFRTKVEKISKRAVTSRAGDYFASLISDHLNPEDYLLLRLCEFSNMRLYAFVRREHAQRISHIDYASQSTGVGGIAGNKGAVAISFRFQQFRLCFISCHLAAHRKFTKERNSDCAEVLSMAQRKLGTHSVSYLSDWDFVFLLGDLNYRLNLSAASPSPPPTSAAAGSEEDVEQFNKIKADHTEQERCQVVDMIAHSQWAELLALDQLRAEQAKGNALVGFQEAAVYPFAPTFKVVDRTNADLNLRYANNRLPAYCDRILWCTTPGMRLYQGHERVAQANLFSPDHMTTSDHNPVCSRFLIDLAGDSQRLSDNNDIKTRLSKSRTGLAASLSLPSPLSPLGGMQIVFWDLRATGLLSQDPTGKSDPYVVAYSPELFPGPKQRGSTSLLGASRTGVKFLTLSCHWKNTVLVIHTPNRFSTPNSLRGRHVTLCVRDFDFSSYDDSMGEAVVLLDDLVNAFEACGRTTDLVPPFDSNTPGVVELRLAILLNGKHAGEMTGLAALRPYADRVKASRSNSDYMWKGRALMESYTQRF
ncbi:hypothetical protein BASA81_002289 [Batrachochytrium salamandrivorans]|nr:hypothetical protein BASA81_002289 [Batrachochytrium salamandrivorans]